jgi:hypothetical protein
MSQTDRDTLWALHEAERGHLTQLRAGTQLQLSKRWVRKLVARFRKEGENNLLFQPITEIHLEEA